MANLIDALRTGSAGGIAASLYDTMEVRTSLSPPIRVRTETLFQQGDGSGEVPWWLKFLKPTVVLTGPGGQQVIAPVGPAGNGTLPMLMVLGGLIGVGFWLGRATK